jgi:hypothetical protein
MNIINNFNFINNSYSNYIKYFIKSKILINLNNTEFENILQMLLTLIEYISIRFCFDKKLYDEYWYEIIQNNHKALIGLFNLIFPYIDDKNNFELHKKIYYISDISKEKDKDNNFIICNIQHNLYINEDNKLYSYNLEDIKTNFLLLLNTIDIISNKLYINWLNIRPICLSNYKETLLYKESIYITRNFNILNDILIPKNKTDKHYNYIINGTRTQVFYHYNKLYFTLPSNERIDLDNMLLYRGLSLVDIFNTLYYDLFYDVYEIKWLIYQNIFEYEDEIYIKKFNEHIAVPGLYLNKKWYELSDIEQNFFQDKIDKYYLLSLSNDKYFNLLKYIIIFFERNYNMINDIVRLYNYESITTTGNSNIIDDDDDDDDDKLNEIDMNKNNFILNIKKIPLEHLYNYLLITIDKFKKTWYGRNIILDKDNKRDGIYIKDLESIKFNYDTYVDKFIEQNLSNNIINNIRNEIIKCNNTDNDDISEDISIYLSNNPINLPDNLTIKYKFFYNYAKAFTLLYTGEESDGKSFKRSDWTTMLLKDREILIKFLNNSYIEAIEKNNNIENNMNVMSFKKYYDRVYNNIKSIDNYYYYISVIIFDIIREKIIDITFENHIYKGLLSNFVVDKNLTDNKLLGSTYQEKKKNKFERLKEIFKRNNYKDCYYYLTNKKYNDLDENKKTYFNLLTSEYDWYTFYSMDWVFQISFFHRYINNRIILVTGATGQGKSTQMPKLFLYALKMINRKNNGKIICSQPMIKATIDISTRIAEELGVPIMVKSENYNQKIKTYNPYVEYNTKSDSHKVSNSTDLCLKLVTDKLLLIELLNNPFFKNVMSNIDESKIGDAVEYNIYTKENLYDIIMVDESHQHNINMDIILTVVRDTIKYNNSLKLVIVSATMDDDEKIYRYYYKEIDDNLSHPYNFYNAYNNLNRRYVDRRIHISPPGETTQYKITEYYEDKEPKDYTEAEEKAYNILMKLLDTNIAGDILLFSIGVEQIKNLVKRINNAISLNNPNSKYVCIPLYSQIPKKWNIVSNLSEEIKKLTIHRDYIYSDIYEKTDNIKIVPENTYKNAIIIATNVAEASLTIDSLRYVIDTGYFYDIREDVITNQKNVSISKISEASRKQRKGRIGRVASGTIYYTYIKGSRENISSTYKICIEGINMELYDIASKDNKSNYIISNILWLNNLNKNLTSTFLNKLITNAPHLKKSNILNALIISQYTYLNKLLPTCINLLSKTTHTDLNYNNFIKIFDNNFNFDKKITYSLITERPIRYLTGYDIKNTIFDIEGIFYIIHPDELRLKRDKITGEIISVDNITSNKIISNRINLYLEKCIKFNLFIKNNLNFIFSLNNNKLNFNYEKTIIGRIINSIIKEFNQLYLESADINWFLINTIIYSFIYDLEDIVIMMISLMHISKYNINYINPNKIFFEKNSNKDDLYIYYDIAVYIYNKIEKIINIDNENKIIDYMNIKKRIYLEEKIKIKNLIIEKKNYWKLNIPIEIYEIFNSLDNENKLNSNMNYFDYLLKKNQNEKIKVIIINIFKQLNINIDDYNLDIFIKYYLNMKYKIDSLKKNNKLIWFKINIPVIKSSNIYDNIKLSFLYGFSCFNTIYKTSSIKYKNIETNINYDIQNTITQYTKYITYLIEQKNNIYILINIDIDTLIKINLIKFSPYYLKNNNNLNINIKDINQNKYKYLKHIKLKDSIIESNNLLKKSNNIIKHIFDLWTD